jgi:hypothetical protein
LPKTHCDRILPISIDIDGLSYDELLNLNDSIITRLKYLDAADTIDAMMKLSLGSKVCFDSGKHGIQVGTLINFNQKTVTVPTDDGRRHWKVSSQMLSPVFEEADSGTNVIDLKTQK